MENKLKVLSLAFILTVAPLAQLVRAQGPASDVEQTAKIKSEVTKRVSKNKTHVKIKLKDGSELKARITQAGENGFTVTDDKTGKQIEVAYSDVAAVKGRSLSTGLKIGIILAVAVVALAVIGIAAVKSIDPFGGGIR
ncbi:MAG: hypothetical protein ACREBG_24135 [Pyrinomonadaceae bacterium]